MASPLVSVILPTYNRLEYVQAAIESVLKQTYPNYEIIVVDDGSIDGTGDTLQKEYGDSIQYHWQVNQGESAARNYGFALAKGEYIAYLDSDDLWHPDKLETQVYVLEKQRNQKAIAVCSSVWRIDSQGKRVGTKPAGRAKRLPRRNLSDFFAGPKIYAPPSNLLIRRGAFQKLKGFDPEIQYGEDWDLVIRLRHLGEILYIDKPLVFYRIHRGSQQGIPDPERFEKKITDHVKVIQKNALLLGPENKKKVELTLALVYEKAAYWSFALDRLAQGFEYLAQAGRLDEKLIEPLNVSQKIGYWAAYKTIEWLELPEVAEEYFCTSFLPRFLKLWPVSCGRPPERRILLAWFYHNLAYQLVSKEKKSKVYLLGVKSLLYYPLFILKPRHMKIIINGYPNKGNLDDEIIY